MLSPEPSRLLGHVDGGGADRSRMLLVRTRAPVVPAGLLHRDRLTAQLAAGAGDRLTVVSAGPGWGKTLAVASWAATVAGRPVAWLSVNESDNDPRSFFADLVAAVTAAGGVRAGSPLLLGHDRAGRFDAVDVDELWVRLADLPVPVVLVIDDFQVITDGAVLDLFGRLLAQSSPPSLRLVLLGRADPVLPLHQLRVGGQLTEIRAADLAFTPAEIVELFTVDNVVLRGDQAALLRARTRGWPAGLRAAALSIDPGNVDAGIDRCRPDELGMGDFFLGEVLRTVPAADLDFLLRTSVADLLTGDLADQLTGRSDGHFVLQRLAHRNVFTVESGVPGWFSYQPMLRELLGHLSSRQQSAVAAGLPLRVAHP